MRRRTVLVIAILAALVGAPSVMFGSTNLLADADVSPTTGTTETVFTLRVAYAGRFPALDVTAHVAGRAIEMDLQSGSSEAGTWGASTTLPAGAWPVVFAATAQRGNSPTLTGVIVTVRGTSSAPASTPAEAAEGPAPAGASSPRQDSIDAGAADGPTDPRNPRAPDSAAVEPDAAEPGREPRAAPSEPDGGQGSVGGEPADARPDSTDGSSASGGGDAEGDADGARAGKPGASPDASPARGKGVAPTVTPAAGNRSLPHGTLAGRPLTPSVHAEASSSAELTGAARVLGVWLAAMLAGLGVLLFLARRRRRGAADGPGGTALDATNAILEQRAARRGRVRYVEDPIVASVLGQRTDAAADEEEEEDEDD